MAEEPKSQTIEDRVKNLEQALQHATKKAAFVAVIAALLGGGGITGIIQLFAGTKAERTDAILKNIEAKYKDEQERIANESAKADLQLKYLQEYKTTIDQLQKSIEALKKSGNQDLAANLTREFQIENSNFLQFLTQTRNLAQQTNTPGWYRGALDATLASTQQQQN